MSGRPYTYGRAMAIAQLMRDHRRPIIKMLAEDKAYGKRTGYRILEEVYLFGEDLFTAYSDTIDWVPKLDKLSRYGRRLSHMTKEQIQDEKPNSIIFSWGTQEIKPIAGWPTEEEIAAEIVASAEREKNWKGSLSANDFSAMARMLG